ncbi:MAG: 50S ribosomal protein L18 [Candidatus Zambryskibacteria bacterium RIFCSPHIGHO2_01_FULL_49_18]|uniref:Large ribosomal subunit protein uL18 n=1 Tax=Candidatus Zambryskibacteria bacterium RIFCSPHIGHO2_01_FULL_49_18 TaxID=1802740 RepID=A0A1G2T4Z7_9BACT|nr:MAG: 50S ribosomal protein L18 [Candidatus Zambryskibacteria bacterium RIFCSPHIGHO2_01_FULL_49_18]
MNKKLQARDRKRKKIRAKISGTSLRPRLSVFKSNTAIYAQIIDDTAGKTLVAAKGSDAAKVGVEVAKNAAGKKIKAVVFDRGGYVYTGKVRALAEAARAAGLEF